MLVDLGTPLGELRQEIVQVGETALLEERALDPADEVFHRTLLVRPVRPADLGGEAELQGGVGEGRVPLGDLASLLPVQRHGLGPVEDRTQRHAAEADEVVGQGADQGLHRLVGDQGHLDPARPLEARGEEVDPAGRAVEEGHVHLPEVVLGELPGQALEAHLDPGRGGPQ